MVKTFQPDYCLCLKKSLWLCLIDIECIYNALFYSSDGIHLLSTVCTPPALCDIYCHERENEWPIFALGVINGCWLGEEGSGERRRKCNHFTTIFGGGVRHQRRQST